MNKMQPHRCEVLGSNSQNKNRRRRFRLGRKHLLALCAAPVVICCVNIYAVVRVADNMFASSDTTAGGGTSNIIGNHHSSTPNLRFASSMNERRRLADQASKSKKFPPHHPDFHVFQIAKPHTGSTLLNCILQGLLEESIETGYAFLREAKPGDKVFKSNDDDDGEEIKDSDGATFPVILHDDKVKRATASTINATMVTKTHLVNVDELEMAFGHKFGYSMYIASNRETKGLGIQNRYCKYPNVLCLDYDDFTYDSSDNENDIEEVVLRVREAMLNQFHVLQNVEMDTNRAIERLKEMEKTTVIMENRPFEVHEPRFGIHGGHRNRGDGLESPVPRPHRSYQPSSVSFVHLTSLYSVKDCDARFCPYGQDQSVAVTSMQRARDKSKKASSVTLATSVLSGDGIAVPDDFVRLPDLNRSTTTEYPYLSPQKDLPFINDVFSNLRLASPDMKPYDYVVYTNADIIVREDFYDVISVAIEQGYDAFTINRQTISKGVGDDENSDTYRLYTAEDLDIIYKTSGDIHPGTDCFVMKRSIFDGLDMGNLFLGYPPFGKLMLAQIEHLAKSFTTFASDELKVTYHLGNDKKWYEGDDDGNCEYTKTNIDNADLGLRDVWTRACEIKAVKDSEGNPSLRYFGDGIPSRTCMMLVNKYRNVDICDGSEEYQEDDAEAYLATEDHHVNASPSHSPVVFQFLVGLEGTGHHLHQNIYTKSDAHELVTDFGLLPDTKSLLLSIWNRKRPSEGLFSALSDISESDEGEWWKEDTDKIDGTKLFDRLVGNLKRVDRKARQKLKANQSLMPGKDLVIAVNSGSTGAVNEVSPFLSYPLLFGPARSLQYIDLDIIYEACTAANVRCQHVVSYRDAYRVLKSTTMNRQFASRHIQLQTLNSMLKVVQGQMLSQPEGLVACWESDEGLSGGVRDLGKLFGWEDPDEFDEFYASIFRKPAPLTDEERMEITKDNKLEVYMHSMVKSMENIKILCKKQLISNRKKKGKIITRTA